MEEELILSGKERRQKWEEDKIAWQRLIHGFEIIDTYEQALSK